MGRVALMCVTILTGDHRYQPARPVPEIAALGGNWDIALIPERPAE